MNNDETMIEIVVDFFNYIFLARKSTAIEIINNLNAKLEKYGKVTANECVKIINENLLNDNCPFVLPGKTIFGDYIEFRPQEDTKVFDCYFEWFLTPEGEKEIGFISMDESSCDQTFFD